MRSLLFVLLLAAVVGAAAVWHRGLKRHVELTEPPARGAVDVAFLAVPSSIGTFIVVPLVKLSDEVNARVPASFKAAGTGEDVCKDFLGKNVCVGTQYDVTLTRGPIVASAVDAETLRLTIPLHASGQGGLRGDLAKLLALDAKNFAADASVAADLRLGLDAQGCPYTTISLALQGVPSVHVEIVGGVWFDLAQTLLGAIAGATEQIQRGLTFAVPCDLVKQQLALVYTSRHHQIVLPDAPPAYINFVPTRLAFSGLTVIDAELRVAAAITGTLQVEPTPVEVQPVPLPPIAPIEPSPPLMKLAVPLRVRYADLGVVVSRALAAQRFRFDSPLGESQVRVTEVEFFPSRSRLAVRIVFSADLPDQWLDVGGEAHLMATPHVDQGTIFSLREVAFTRVVDNDVWKALSVAFESSIRDAIEEAARLDIAPSIAQANQRLGDALKQPIEGMVIDVSDLRLALGRVAVADDAISIEGLAEARVIVSPAL